MQLGKRSVFWAGLDTGGAVLLTMATMLLMARLMTPAMFGTGALVLGTIQLLDLFAGGLFHDGLIQAPEIDDTAYEKAFWLMMIVAGMMISLFLVGALFCDDTTAGGVAWLLFGASLSLLPTSALGIANARLRRDLSFRDVALPSLLGRLGGCAAGIGFAASGFGAWSLIVQYNAGMMVQAVATYARTGWRPTPRLSYRSLWPICRFALPYAFMHAMIGIRTQLFQFMVAIFINLTGAGFVNLAFRLTSTPLGVLNTAFTNIGLPLLARQQHSQGDMERAYLDLTRLVLPVTVPTFVGLALVAKQFVPIVLGAEWTRSVPLVQLLAIGGAIAFMRFPASTVLRALGYVRFSFFSAMFQLVFTTIGMVVIFYVEDSHALTAAVAVWVIPALIQLPVAICCLHRVARISFRTSLRGILPVIVATFAMVCMVREVDLTTVDTPILTSLMLQIVTGGLTAIGTFLLIDRKSRLVVFSSVRRRA
ncbi:oligosaccharide flippase family protein [Rhodopila sp.]|uniref:oligosaccharide flippase family protein n=1 Tax=Rhodopila sp. TaxID=2480087 RepID=UPI003D0F0447